MTIRLLAYSASFFVALAPTVSFASVADLRFSYAQATSMNGSNLVKVAFDRLATSSTGALTSVGQYVSYIRPTASMIARVVLPRLLLAASGVGTVALVGYGVYELWKYMESKGYSFDSLTNSISFGGSKVADVSNPDKLDDSFLNDLNSYYSGGFSIFAYGQYGSNATVLKGTNALSVCNQFLASATLYNSNFKASNCVISGIGGSIGPIERAVNFTYTLVDNASSNPKPQSQNNYLSANVGTNSYDVKEEVKGVSVPANSLADHIANPGVKPGEAPSFISDFFASKPDAYKDLIQNVFNPAYPEALQNIEEAKSEARPGYVDEVATVAPPGSVTSTDQVIPLPNTDATTKNPDGSVNQQLPAFCSYAPSVCQMADKFLTTVNPENEKVPEIKHEITVSDRLKISAQCPAPLTFDVMGNSFDITYDFVCSFAEKIRPIVLSAGYVGSAFLVLRRI